MGAALNQAFCSVFLFLFLLKMSSCLGRMWIFLGKCCCICVDVCAEPFPPFSARNIVVFKEGRTLPALQTAICMCDVEY